MTPPTPVPENAPGKRWKLPQLETSERIVALLVAMLGAGAFIWPVMESRRNRQEVLWAELLPAVLSPDSGGRIALPVEITNRSNSTIYLKRASFFLRRSDGSGQGGVLADSLTEIAPKVMKTYRTFGLPLDQWVGFDNAKFEVEVQTTLATHQQELSFNLAGLLFQSNAVARLFCKHQVGDTLRVRRSLLWRARQGVYSEGADFDGAWMFSCDG